MLNLNELPILSRNRNKKIKIKAGSWSFADNKSQPVSQRLSIFKYSSWHEATTLPDSSRSERSSVSDRKKSVTFKLELLCWCGALAVFSLQSWRCRAKTHLLAEVSMKCQSVSSCLLRSVAWTEDSATNQPFYLFDLFRQIIPLDENKCTEYRNLPDSVRRINKSLVTHTAGRFLWIKFIKK